MVYLLAKGSTDKQDNKHAIFLKHSQTLYHHILLHEWQSLLVLCCSKAAWVYRVREFPAMMWLVCSKIVFAKCLKLNVFIKL